MHQQKIQNKAQEEIIGFVVIMLVVAVIFVIFLGIYISNNSEQTFDSLEVSQFLDSALDFTTECSYSSTGYNPMSVEKLLKECREEKFCYNGKSTCEILNNNLKNLTESAWNFGPNRPEKNYLYEINYKTASGNKEPLNEDFTPPFSSGFVAGGTRYKGASRTISAGNGNIIVNLKIYLEQPNN